MATLQANQIGISLLFSTSEQSSLPATLWSFIGTRIQQRTRRAAFKEMLNLPPHLLKDIGVTYGDVKCAANLPFEIDAAKKLKQLSQRGLMIL